MNFKRSVTTDSTISMQWQK